MLGQAVSLLDGVGPFLTLDDVNDRGPLEEFSWHGGDSVPTLDFLEAVVGRCPLVAGTAQWNALQQQYAKVPSNRAEAAGLMVSQQSAQQGNQ